MPISVSQDVINFIAAERTRFEQQAAIAESDRNAAEVRRIESNRIALDLAEVLADLEVEE